MEAACHGLESLALADVGPATSAEGPRGVFVTESQRVH